MSVLLDTGVLFAFLNKDDARHGEAIELLRRVATGSLGAPFTSDYVVDELFTLIRARTKSRRLEEAARSLLPLPEPGLRGLEILPVARDRLVSVWEAFARHRDRGISFTDASSLVVMAAFGVDFLATFDRKLEGLTAVPPR